MSVTIAQSKREVFLDLRGFTIDEAEVIGELLANDQRGINWWIGDLARYARYVLKLGDNYSQVFPAWMSPGLIQRCEAVALAYPKEEDRNPLATWSQHMHVAKEPNRIALVADMVNKGETSDASRQRRSEGDPQWLLAVDVNYFLHRFWYSGAGVEAAMSLASWIERTVDRLKAKGLTDCLCAFDDDENHRKALTADWEDKYKDRPPKDPELLQQLQLVRDLLEIKNFACVSFKGMEADDVLASASVKFPGRVTLMTQDKDVRQCLSASCNILLDVKWEEDPTSGEHLPNYQWLSVKSHTEQTGIAPSQWTQYQAIMGDSTDGITGVAGIGEKGAAQLIQTFGSAEAVIAAAKDDDERIPPKKRQALIEFQGKLDVTLQLVTLRTDLEITRATRIVGTVDCDPVQQRRQVPMRKV